VPGAVLGHDQHAVAGPHAVGAQLALGGVDERAERGERPRAVRLVDEHALRIARAPGVEGVVQARRCAAHSNVMPFVTPAHSAKSLAACAASTSGPPVHFS
jgi:hypothetical protein